MRVGMLTDGVVYSVVRVLSSLHSSALMPYQQQRRKLKIQKEICLSGSWDHLQYVPFFTFYFHMYLLALPTGRILKQLEKKHRLLTLLKHICLVSNGSEHWLQSPF